MKLTYLKDAEQEITDWDVKTHSQWNLVVEERRPTEYTEGKFIAFVEGAKIDGDFIYGFGNTPDEALQMLCGNISGRSMTTIDETKHVYYRVPQLKHTLNYEELVNG